MSNINNSVYSIGDNSVNKTQYEQLKKDPIKKVGWVKASLIPVRSNGADLAKDLFLPTFFNHALKLDSLAKKIIMGVGTIIYDVLTLPIRLITVIPRLLFGEKSYSEVARKVDVQMNGNMVTEEKFEVFHGPQPSSVKSTLKKTSYYDEEKLKKKNKMLENLPKYENFVLQKAKENKDVNKPQTYEISLFNRTKKTSFVPTGSSAFGEMQIKGAFKQMKEFIENEKDCYEYDQIQFVCGDNGIDNDRWGFESEVTTDPELQRYIDKEATEGEFMFNHHFGSGKYISMGNSFSSSNRASYLTKA